MFTEAAFRRCSENMQKIFRRTLISMYDFSKVALLKSHFGMSVVLYICLIFSEHLSLKTLLEAASAFIKRNDF